MKKSAGSYALLAVCAVASNLALSGCRQRQTIEAHSIHPSLWVNKTRALMGSPIELTYRFDVAEESQPMKKDHSVFVHFIDESGALVFTDDHEPPTATSTWQVDSTVEYSRTLFIPKLESATHASIEMGLYDSATGKQLRLDGSDGGRSSYTVGRIILRIPEEEDLIDYKDGWHPQEASREDPNTKWRWTKKEARCSFKNPRQDTAIYIHADTNVEAFEKPPVISILVGNEEVRRFQLLGRESVLKRIPVPANVLEDDDWVDLRIINHQAFVPSEQGLGNDSRELGLRVYNLYVAPERFRRTSDQPLERILIEHPQKPSHPYKRTYDFSEGWDFFTRNIPIWETALADFKGKPAIQYLEIGVLEGRSAIWMLENILTHPTARLTGADIFIAVIDGVPVKDRFLDNIQRAGAANKVTVLEGFSQEHLRKLPLYSYDIIYIDGSHIAKYVLEDAVQSFRLLKPGGVLIFDDYEWHANEPHESRPMMAINIFVELFREEFEIIHRDSQVLLRKRGN